MVNKGGMKVSRVQPKVAGLYFGSKVILHTIHNKGHSMHAEAMTFHKGSLRIFRKLDRKFQQSK